MIYNKDIQCLDKGYSTTELVIQEKLAITNNSNDKFETSLFLSEGENRRREGGLRTKGYFKKSFEDKPLISIITIVFNGEEYLERTVKSVTNQTYINIEYIIIDGGSIDKTLSIIEKYRDKIDYYISEKDNGIYNAMNKGLHFSTGDFILMLNAGDYFYNNYCLRKVISRISDLNEVYFTQAEVKSGDNSYLKPKNSINYNVWLNNNLPIHQSVFVPKNLKYIQYDESLKITADSLYLKRLQNICKFNYIDELMVVFSLGGISSYYKSFSHLILHIKEHLKYLNLTNGSLIKKIYIIIAFFGKYLLSRIINEKKYYAIIKKFKKY